MNTSINGRRLPYLVFVGLTLASCSRSQSTAADQTMSFDSEIAETTTTVPPSEVTVAGETYDQYDERRDALDGTAGNFAGEGCTQDCGGHEAGYQWAAENSISDSEQCGGKSWSFIEGCRSYLEEHSETDR